MALHLRNFNSLSRSQQITPKNQTYILQPQVAPDKHSSMLNLSPTDICPTWKIYPSQSTVVVDHHEQPWHTGNSKTKKRSSTVVNRKNVATRRLPPTAHGLLRVRSNTHVGRAAGLMRWSDTLAHDVDGDQRHDEIEALLLLPNTDHKALTHNYNGNPNRTHRASKPPKWIHYVEMIKRLLMLLVYRLPRAVREWQLWIMAASYGFYHLLYHGNTLVQRFSGQYKLRDGLERQAGEEATEDRGVAGENVLRKARDVQQRQRQRMRNFTNQESTSVVTTSDQVTQIRDVHDRLATSLLKQFDKVMSHYNVVGGGEDFAQPTTTATSLNGIIHTDDE